MLLTALNYIISQLIPKFWESSSSSLACHQFILKERAFIGITEDLSFDFNEFWVRPIIHQSLVFPLVTKLPAGIHFCITGLCLAEHWHGSTKLTSEMIQVLTFSHLFMLEEKHITEFMALRVRAMTCTKQQYIYFGIVDTLNVRLWERLGVGEAKRKKPSNGLKYMKKYNVNNGLWKLLSSHEGKV